ncbi:hypothetical protein Q73A0000_13895 [Kaistella flava (ex Peng et al. 2021)]|uniref:Uncharacterized protein n=1 Tax=Kaistella flava (ex Peng et al. 2021) TaxID=2038776 RepID=A0A7M2YCJ8_9FLAO|nr:hypothetical protein [Kaistella flava (ex Peng et al. 2021)]QOW11375.1 hypothetical protein Q73A0000_13895 [Kaistella flava (ex Peng et al. 2021)]
MFKPDTYKLTYTLDEVKKTFAQYKLQTAEKELLPELIRIVINNGFNAITGAYYLLLIRNATSWKKCTLTGLRPTDTANYYYSDLPIKGVKSLCVVYYDSETDKILIRIAPQFYIQSKIERENLVKELIKNF